MAGMSARNVGELPVGLVVPTPTGPARSSCVSVACLLVFVMSGSPQVIGFIFGVSVLTVVVDDRCAVGGAGVTALAAR